MTGMSLIGFARVSSSQQDLTAQLKTLRSYGCIKTFEGKHLKKADTNKQALKELLSYVSEGDTVIVTKLDSLGRSISQVLSTLHLFNDRGIKFVAIDQSVDTSKKDSLSKAMIQLLGMFAEMERNFIIFRTSEGKAQSGNYGGRKPKLTEEQRLEVKAKLSQGISKAVLSKEYNVSRATILNISKS
jgi:DNA invertase Pin-like site-specific DNA recombinase